MIKSSPKRLFIATQDPGGALALLPVIKYIKSDKRFESFNLKIFVGEYSYNLFKEKKIRFTKAGEFSQKDLIMHFRKFNPNLVLTSTSSGFSIEKKILRIAKKFGIKTISMIDFWSNYWLRFIRKGEKKSLEYLPDNIVVIDGFMREEMKNLGFPKKRLKVLGSPHFGTFKTKSSPKNKKIAQILFISQPLRKIYTGKNNLGYDEFSVLKDIIDIIGKVKENNKKIHLVIRLHPKDNKNKYKGIIKSQLNSGIRIKVDSQGNLDSLIAKSDLILGMSSMVLFRASFSKNPVISYQPGLKNHEKDSLISNRLKLSKLSTNKSQLKERIFRVLFKKQKPKNDFLKRKFIKKYLKSNSTKNVVNLIHRILER